MVCDGLFDLQISSFTLKKLSEVSETPAITTQSKAIITSHTIRELQNIQVTYKLNGKNYLKWSKLVRNFLEVKGKFSHLLRIGPQRRDPRFDAWDEQDSMIMAWLWNSVTPKINDTYVPNNC